MLRPARPQVGKGMNRDYWARFERFVQLLADTCSDVWIITGPLYLPVPTKDGFRMNHALLGERKSFHPSSTHERTCTHCARPASPEMRVGLATLLTCIRPLQ